MKKKIKEQEEIQQTKSGGRIKLEDIGTVIPKSYVLNFMYVDNEGEYDNMRNYIRVYIDPYELNVIEVDDEDMDMDDSEKQMIINYVNDLVKSDKISFPDGLSNFDWRNGQAY